MQREKNRAGGESGREKAEKRWRKHGQVPGKLRGTPPRYSPAAQAHVLGIVPGVSVSQLKACPHLSQFETTLISHDEVGVRLMLTRTVDPLPLRPHYGIPH